jgi:hypothetical protein
MTATAFRPSAVFELDATRFLLVLLHLAGVYVAVPLRGLGSFEFPAATMLLTVPLLLAANLGRIRVQHLYPMLGLLAVGLLSVLLAPQAGDFLGARLKGLVQWGWSILCAYVLVLELSHWPRNELARLFGGLSLAILIGCVLENYGGLRAVSNAFRRVVFVSASNEWLSRDIEIAGMLRPRLFTSEPSDVAKFFVLTVFGWVATSVSHYRYAGALLLAVAGMWLIRSPIVLLLVPLLALLLLFGRPLAGAPVPLSRPLKATGLVMLVALGSVVIVPLLAARAHVLLAGAEPSSLIRLAAPVLVAGQTLQMSPMWGAGISGTEAIADIIIDAYTLFGLAKFADPLISGEHMTVANLITNAFWLHWINFGLLGGTLALWFTARWMTALGVRRRMLAFLAIMGFAQTMGAMHGPYFWSYIAVILAVVRHLDDVGPLKLRFVPARVLPGRPQPQAGSFAG